MKKINLKSFSKPIILYEHRDCKDQAERWMRYTEDFMRRFIDKDLDDEKFAEAMTKVLYFGAILIIVLFVWGLHHE